MNRSLLLTTAFRSRLTNPIRAGWLQTNKSLNIPQRQKPRREFNAASGDFDFEFLLRHQQTVIFPIVLIQPASL